MDFGILLQIKAKKSWWSDLVFYLAVSILIATLVCYGVFLLKDATLRQAINDAQKKIDSFGSQEQKDQEARVLDYQKKFNGFAIIFKNHYFASNAFAFMESQTMPNIWFNRFALDAKGSQITLSGEADSMDAFSRQVAVFEKNDYVKSVSLLNSSVQDTSKTGFNINLVLDNKIFSYIENRSAQASPGLDSFNPLNPPVVLQQPGTGTQQTQPGNKSNANQ